MSKCLNELCGNKAKGRSKYCSGKCKTAHNRHKPGKTDTPCVGTVTQTTKPTHVDKVILAAFNKSHPNCDELQRGVTPEVKTATQAQLESVTLEPSLEHKVDEIVVESIKLAAKVEQERAKDLAAYGDPRAEQPATFDDIADMYNHDAPSLEHYQACPDQYCPRQEPEKLNWGPWLTSKELKQAGLKANRVPIPGDWDYEGCVTPERIAASLRT